MATPDTVTQAFEAYFHEGWDPVPLKPRSKQPAGGDGWNQKHYTRGDFSDDGNIGVLNRQPVDLDLDCDEARDLAADFHRITLTFGRSSTPEAHWLFDVNGQPYRKYLDRAGVTMIEVRATPISQTMFPPSIHPTGERIEWTAGFDPSRIVSMAAEELDDRTRRHAFATILVRDGWARGEAIGRAQGDLDDLTDLTPELAAHVRGWDGWPAQPPPDPPDPPRGDGEGNHGGGGNHGKAKRLRWLDAHPRDYPRGGTRHCPVCCGGKRADCKCWGLGKKPGKSVCWNTDHGGVVGADGQPVGWHDKKHECYVMDALDLWAWENNQTPNRVLDDWTEPEPAPGNGAPAAPGGSPSKWGQHPSEHCTELGNSKRLAHKYGEDLRYVGSWKKWYVWDSAHWVLDVTGMVMRRAKLIPDVIRTEAFRLGDSKEMDALVAWSYLSESRGKLNAMIDLASSDRKIAATPEMFDSDPFLLNVANGTIDLRTGKLRSHRREDMMTRIVNVQWNPDALCLVWDAFLERILPDADVREFVQRAVGYSLTGDIAEQVFFILWGEGANGKSTFMEIVARIVGEYAQNAAKSTFTSGSKSNDKIPNDLASMKGARLVYLVETGEEHGLDETLIKAMTGGDPVRARFFRAEWFTYRPQFKPWLITNHKPRIRGTDLGIWRRLRLIPFIVQIPEGERDLHYSRKLLAELPGILRWAVDGCVKTLASGLQTPATVTGVTKGYRAEQAERQQRLAEFIADRCELDSRAWTSTKELRAAYTTWCLVNAEEVITGTEFTKALKLAGCEARPGTAGLRGWQGIRLLPVAPRPSGEREPGADDE